MFGIGMTEVAIILLVALVFIGPDKLPKVARTLGKGMRELRRASDDIKSTIMLDNDETDFYRAPPPPPKRVPVAADNEVDKSAAIAGSLLAGDQVEDAEFAELSSAEGDESSKEDAKYESAAVENTVGRGGSSAAVTDAGKSHPSSQDPADDDKSRNAGMNDAQHGDEHDHSGMPSLEEAGLQAARATALHQERKKAADDDKNAVKESA